MWVCYFFCKKINIVYLKDQKIVLKRLIIDKNLHIRIARNKILNTKAKMTIFLLLKKNKL